MIERFEFDSKVVGPQGLNPFLREGSGAPLRVTFHTPTLKGLSEIETEALAALEELSSLPAVQALHADRKKPYWIQYDASDTDHGSIPVTTFSEDGWVRSGSIFTPQIWLDIAAKLAGRGGTAGPQAANEFFEDLLFAQAHIALCQHVLVTASPCLLKHRHEFYLRSANIRSPQEAAQLVGLLLRSRNVFVYRVSHLDVMPKGYQHSMNRGLFYWALTRYRLPSMWHYFSTCIEADRAVQPSIPNRRHDAFGRLGESILRRADRASQARDAIGMLFYLSQDNDTRDDMMYHFDYLTLLLTGAIDAQAGIAYHAYRPERVRERNASFRRTDFVSALQNRGATQLHSLVTSFRFQQLTTLLYTLRNTVHGSALSTIANRPSSLTELAHGSYLHLSDEQRPDVEIPALHLGGLESWGIVRTAGLFLVEPYSFATKLVAECLLLIDQIAAATDLGGLFQNGISMPALLGSSPQDSVFSEDSGQRLSVLG